jgi:ubiquinone biosynthesis protein
VPIDVIHATLADELGPLDRLGVRLAPAALAEASVAVVIPFEDDGGRHGVFKVLKPGVVERLEEELDLFERVGRYLDEKCDEFQIPHLDYRESFEQVRDKLRQEVRFDGEQRHLELARAAYADEPRVQVPALFEHCTPRVTAMERVSGGKITDHGLGCGWERRRLANLLGEALVARPFFSRAGRALFHADPHAGNLFLTGDGRLALLDWSLVGWLGEPERVAVVQALLAAATLQPGRVVALLSTLADRGRIDRPALESVVHRWVAQVRCGRFPGFTWLVGLLDEAVQTAGVRLGADLMLFRKALHTLAGVAADVGAGGDYLDGVLIGEFLCHLALEWPLRWLAPLGSRAFATRLSNADLAGFLLHFPCALTRCWLEQCRPRSAGR